VVLQYEIWAVHESRVFMSFHQAGRFWGVLFQSIGPMYTTELEKIRTSIYLALNRAFENAIFDIFGTFLYFYLFLFFLSTIIPD
jgi:hypothetical protein